MAKRQIVRRDQINDHCTRYYLSNGWFIDRDSPRLQPGKYTLYAPGIVDGCCGPIAGVVAFGDTLTEVLAAANL